MRWNRVRILCSFLLLTVLLTGCCLFPFPLDPSPKIKIDSQLLGTWKCSKGMDDKFLVIKRKDDYSYLVSSRKHRKGKDTFFDAFLSEVTGAQFLNLHVVMRDSADSLTGYQLIRLLRRNESGKRITAEFFTDTVAMGNEYKSSAEVRAMVTSQLNNPRCYNGTFEMNRVGKGLK